MVASVSNIQIVQSQTSVNDTRATRRGNVTQQGEVNLRDLQSLMSAAADTASSLRDLSIAHPDLTGAIAAALSMSVIQPLSFTLDIAERSGLLAPADARTFASILSQLQVTPVSATAETTSSAVLRTSALVSSRSAVSSSSSSSRNSFLTLVETYDGLATRGTAPALLKEVFELLVSASDFVLKMVRALAVRMDEQRIQGRKIEKERAQDALKKSAIDLAEARKHFARSASAPDMRVGDEEYALGNLLQEKALAA